MTTVRPRADRPVPWALLAAPRGVLPLYLGVEAAAVLLVGLCPWGVPDGSEWARFGALLVISCLQTELSLGIEKARRYRADRPHVSMTSVWMFAGAVVLPAAMAVGLTVFIYLHLWFRVWRPVQGRSAYRVVFSATTVVLGCLAAGPVLRLLGVSDILVDVWHGCQTLFAVIAGALAYTTINGVLVAVGIKLHHPRRPWTKTFGTKAENALELATLSLGGVTALVLVTQPVLVTLMLLPVIVLHRNILVRQLEEKAAKDSKTGLLTAEEWRGRVANEVLQSTEPFGVLMVDLDRFKRVNDTYGHMAGDTVLRAVAETVTGQLRAYDSVGRWGGEEFAVLLPRIPHHVAQGVAERVRAAVDGLVVTVRLDDTSHVITGLSVSVGVACFPDAGTTVDSLVHAADTAMYQAKRAGRNTVVSNLRPRPPS